MQKFFLVILVLPTFLSSFVFGQVENFKVPSGFQISLFSQGMPKVRAMAWDDDTGVLYASTGAGNVYRISANGKNTLIVKGLKNSIGIVFFKGDLIVSSIDTLYKISAPNQINKVLQPKDLTVLYNRLPKETHHGGRYLSIMGHTLLVNVGVPCNICQSENPMFGNILGFDLTQMPFKSYFVVARGIRNSVGQDVDPVSGKLFFSDNGQDNLGEDFPFEEINRLENTGEHFGFPYLANTRANKEYSPPKGLVAVAPFFLLPPHSAPLGIHFYRGKQFPRQYQNALFVALHGSWVRKKQDRSGYEVQVITFDNKRNVQSSTLFLSGMIHKNQPLGRPVDIKEDKNGNLFVSDDLNGVIYKITYHK